MNLEHLFLNVLYKKQPDTYRLIIKYREYVITKKKVFWMSDKSNLFCCFLV